MTRATYTGKCCIVSRETGAGASYASAARAWSQSQAPSVHSCLAGKATDNGRHWPLQPLSLLSTDENPSRPHSSVRHNIWSSSLVITWSSWSVSVSEWCHAGHVRLGRVTGLTLEAGAGWCLVLWPRPRHYWGHWGRPQCLLPSVHSASASPGVSPCLCARSRPGWDQYAEWALGTSQVWVRAESDSWPTSVTIIILCSPHATITSIWYSQSVPEYAC